MNVDPAGPVFCPRLTRTLASCSPRSHPSSHALFHPGETIVHVAGRAAGLPPMPLPSPSSPTRKRRCQLVRRKGKRNVSFFSLFTFFPFPTRWNAAATRWIRGVPSRRAKLSVSRPSAARRWTKVGPRGAKGRPPRSLYGGAAPRPRSKTCRNGRKGWPTLLPLPHGQPPRGHDAPRSIYQPRIGSIGDFNGLIGKKGCLRSWTIAPRELTTFPSFLPFFLFLSPNFYYSTSIYIY